MFYLERRPLRSIFAIVVVLVPLSCVEPDPEVASETDVARVSEFGKYEGYSEARFDGWVTESQYVEVRDGVRLAMDVTRPTRAGAVATERLPVVWTHSRYHRNPSELARRFASDPDAVPEIRSNVDVQSDLQRLIRHGYVVAAAGVRGSGASFGTYEGLFSDAETSDAADLIEWLADQPWSDGNVGMYGGSYLGITQYMAASEKPPALKAIFPNVAGLDMYDVVYPGGVFRDDMIDHWGELTRDLDLNMTAPPVDSDVEGVLVSQAVEEHEDNWDVVEQYRAGRFRDYESSDLAWQTHGPTRVLGDVVDAGVPAYHWNGWYDIFVTDATLWFANYESPQKLGIGAWSHSGMADQALMAERAELGAIEQHRWFDYWLKGIDNGVLDEAGVHYAVMNEPGDWRWESADAWPPDTEAVSYYFTPDRSGSVESVNDGSLTPIGPTGSAYDEYAVDLTTTTGTATRWDNAVGAAPLMVYPDLAPNDAKSLTYTTPPLESDLTVTGHPVVTLYVTSSQDDADFFVLLEEVGEDGSSRYVTEGVLRASHRALGTAAWDNIDLPFHRSFASDKQPLPAEPTALEFDLHPTSTVFNAGHRLRVTVMGADLDNAEEIYPTPPTVRVYHSSVYPSGIELPIAG